MCSASRKSVAPAFLSTCKLLTKSKKLYRSVRRLQNQNSRTVPKQKLFRKQTNRFYMKLVQRSLITLPFSFSNSLTMAATTFSTETNMWPYKITLKLFSKSVTNPNLLQHSHEQLFCESTELSENNTTTK